MENRMAELRQLHHTLEETLLGVQGVAALESALVRLAEDTEVSEAVAELPEALALWKAGGDRGDDEEREMALLELYRLIHGGGWGFSEAETAIMKRRKGVNGLPGGFLPLLLASRLVTRDTRFVDLGAANGLQGLLLQELVPHAHTLQVELSSSQIAVGMQYQRILGISQDRISWHHGDIFEADLGDADMIYLYRPVRPLGEGLRFYDELAMRLTALSKIRPLTIISVADCLKSRLPLDAGAGSFAILLETEFLVIYQSC